MKRALSVLSFAFLLALVCAGAYRYWPSVTAAGTCQVCGRALHERGEVAALAGGKRRLYCCLACARSDRRQSGVAVEITAFRDFLTDKPLRPAGAFLVEASGVNLCVHRHLQRDPDKQVSELEYDRCSPSVLAFENRAEASRFAARNGGHVIDFPSWAVRLR